MIMRHAASLACWLLVFPCVLFAQEGKSVWQDQQPEIIELPAYPKVDPARSTLLRMAFASPVIRNPEVWHAAGKQVTQVDVVLTRYPHALESWEVGYDSLMHRRIRALFQLVPSLQQQEKLQWRIVLQTAGADLNGARKMLHGIVLHHQPLPVPDPANPGTVRPARFDTVKLKENFDLVLRLVAGEESYHDSTALHVLDRHPEWKDLLVVVDWTASMYQHGALLVRWQREHENAIRNFVFFNDGDAKYDDEKVPGATGGIYGTEGLDSLTVDEVMEAVTLGGEGGDHRENDLEAVRYALDNYFDYESLVLVADNDGPVRDLRELRNLDQPIRIILSGVYKEDIEPDYLTIALHTGGSIHTRNFDLEDIAGQLKHGFLTLGENKYELRGKRFVRKREDW